MKRPAGIEAETRAGSRTNFRIPGEKGLTQLLAAADQGWQTRSPADGRREKGTTPAGAFLPSWHLAESGRGQRISAPRSPAAGSWPEQEDLSQVLTD